MEFGCETCGKFHIHRICALFPSRIRHRWDPHAIPFYQGCEICEEEINPKLWLYHCRECDQSFHTNCLRPLHNVKLGGTLLEVEIHPHTLTFVLKKKSNNCPLICGRVVWTLLVITYSLNVHAVIFFSVRIAFAGNTGKCSICFKIVKMTNYSIDGHVSTFFVLI